MLTEKTFDTGTVKINYAEGPPSGMPLVMLHGVTTWWQTFLPVLPWFLVRYHVYALDLRGHGRSGRAPGAYSIGNDAEDGIAFLRDQVAEPAVLLGWSLGAMASILVAAQAPALVHAIVLEDPPLDVMTETAASPPTVAAFQMFRAWREVITMDGSTEERLSAVAAIIPQADAATVRRRLKQLNQCDPEMLTLIVERKKFEPYRWQELLPQIPCPVLLLQADPASGAAVEDHDAELAASLLADCTHVRLPGVGHGIHAEQPTTFSRIVMDFLESL